MFAEPQRSPPLEDLEAFVRLAESGSFTEAARRMRLPKSTVSRRIARLERTLATPLVARTLRRVVLTEAGAAYLERVGPALARIDEASQAAREAKEEPRGHLRVTAPFDVAMWWLAPLVASFRERHPDVSIEVVVDDRPRDLVAEGIDLAIRAAPRLEDSGLTARRIAAIELSLWASPAYLDARGRPASPEDLGAHDLVAPRAAQERGALLVRDAGGVERTVAIRAGVGTNDLPFAHRVALAGGGIAVLPSTAPCRGHDGLERVLPGWSLETTSLYLLHAGGRLVPAKVRALRDWLVAHAADAKPGEGCPRSASERAEAQPVGDSATPHAVERSVLPNRLPGWPEPPELSASARAS